MTTFPQTRTSPKRQYVATAVVAIIAMVSALTVVSEKNPVQHNTTFQAMSVNEHSTLLEVLRDEEYQRAEELPLPWEMD